MVFTKKKSFVFTAIVILITLVVGLYFVGVSFQNENALTRTVDLENGGIDYQSILSEFEDSTIEKINNTTYFEGYQALDVSLFDELDNVSLQEKEEIASECRVKYNFSYDSEANIVTISAEMKNQYGEIEVEELSGVGFINDKNEIDAVLNVEGESILLSEMQDSGIIANAGWFSKLIKSVVKAVVVVAVVAVVAATVVATAGAAAPALVAAGVGIAGSAAITAGSAALGVAAGALVACTLGKAAIQAGTAIGEVLGNGLEQVVEKVGGAIVALIITGVEYATKAITSSKIDIQSGQYKLVAFSKSGLAYITLSNFDRTKAVWALRLGISTYSSESNAYVAAKDAGNDLSPRQHSAHKFVPNTNMTKLKKGVFFDHYHAYNKTVTYDTLGYEIPVGHACYGAPSIQ